MSEIEIVEQKNLIIRELVFILNAVGVQFESLELMAAPRLLSEDEYQLVQAEIDDVQEVTEMDFDEADEEDGSK